MSGKRIVKHTEMDASDCPLFSCSVSRALEQAIRITRTGGLLTDEQPANPGHPFVLNHQQLEPVLLSRFKPVLKRIVPRAEVSEPEMHYGALVFAGRKLSADHL